MSPDSDVASEAFRIGASGYLLKTSQSDKLLRAVRDVVSGMSYVTPQIQREMEERFIPDPKTVSRPKHLTPPSTRDRAVAGEGPISEGNRLHSRHLDQDGPLP